MNVAFQEVGNGFPVILLHAFPLSGEMWEQQAEFLADNNFRVVLPDLRGFGETTNFADINTMEDMAKDISELLDTLKIEQAIIGGLSMGGYVLFNLYRLYPQKFKAIILCDTNYADDTEEKRHQRFELIDQIEDRGGQALIDNMLPHLIGEFTKNSNPELVENLTRMFSEINPQAAVAALRGMAERQDHTSLLTQIDIPTLLIFGEEDKVTNLEIAAKMKENIQSSIFVKIKNAGHYSNLEQPEMFNQAIIKFVHSLHI